MRWVEGEKEGRVEMASISSAIFILMSQSLIKEGRAISLRARCVWTPSVGLWNKILKFLFDACATLTLYVYNPDFSYTVHYLFFGLIGLYPPRLNTYTLWSSTMRGPRTIQSLGSPWENWSCLEIICLIQKGIYFVEKRLYDGFPECRPSLYVIGILYHSYCTGMKLYDSVQSYRLWFRRSWLLISNNVFRLGPRGGIPFLWLKTRITKLIVCDLPATNHDEISLSLCLIISFSSLLAWQRKQ